MSEISEEKRKIIEENRQIYARRVLKGKKESKIYPSIYLAFALFCSFICVQPIHIIVSLLLSIWLLFATPFGRHVYSWGNLLYGLYVFYVLTCDLPVKGADKIEILSLLGFIIYIIFSSIKVFSSEGIKAYLYEKNSD